MMRKKLPVGIESFEEFSKENFYYVDKTMFISELLHNWGKVNLFTRPRRFGKSLNMSMLKTFFEIGGNKTLFDGLKIMREKDLCEKYMGRYPVISITLKNVDGMDFELARTALKNIIGMEAMRFQFLEKSDKLAENEKEMYRALIHVENGIFTMPDSAMMTGLKVLSGLLFKHYDSKVIILIDEYDVPLEKAFRSGYYDKMISVLRNLFSNALKTNESLYFSVLTGCLRISKESIFTGLNNLNVMTITEKYYEKAFGFTEKEVKEMLRYYGLEEALETMRLWYDGYQFGDASIYCPWDVIKYAQALLKDKDAEPENYWANTSGNDAIRSFISMADRQTKKEIECLIEGESIEKNVNQELTYNELENSIDNLWSVLFATGYLTQKGKKSGKKYQLIIPNQEIRELFISQIMEWFEDETRADYKKLEHFCRSFPNGDMEKIEEILNEYLWNSISIRDIAVKNRMKENFFHGMLLGLLQYENNWEVLSNVELGEGYSDITIKTENRIGIIIELKYAHDGNLDRACQDALKQIKGKKYEEILLRDGMKKIVRYGIAFFKKNCKVEMG